MNATVAEIQSKLPFTEEEFLKIKSMARDVLDPKMMVHYDQRQQMLSIHDVDLEARAFIFSMFYRNINRLLATVEFGFRKEGEEITINGNSK